MSTLILSSITNIISSAIGKRVGNSIEAILKNSLGKDLDAALLHKNKPHLAKDMRLQDIKVQTSTYGKMIPDVYGTVRISGNIIWAQQIKYTQHREVDITDTTSRNTQTINNYHATLAIALCSGPVHRVSKVWANGKPVDLDTLKYRLYKGTEEQEPDPLICSIEGSAPAYLGLSYIVIENFPLRDYNNAIPNFVFEVTSYPEHFLKDHVVQKIHCIHTIAPGEFVYDTEVQKSVAVEVVGKHEIPYGTAIKINGEKGQQKSHALLSLDALKDTFPHLKWIAVTVSWFANNQDIKNCKVYPITALPQNVQIVPNDWKVGNFTRKTAGKIPVENGKAKYPGTVNDASLLRYIRELKSRGYKVLLIIKLVIDAPSIAHLTCSSVADIDPFFRYQYRPFMEHYCLLTRGAIDAFVIGSGLSGLTKIKTQKGAFPGVLALVRMAKHAKKTLGNNTIVTYAANWDEYHSHNGVYNMDALWTSSAIDVVGINAYFPLVDTPHHGFGVQDIVKAWNSGEGYDYFYSDPTTKSNKVSYSGPDFAWKNIYHWWNNDHKKASWKARSKKIWFIEYGFPSIEECTYKQCTPDSGVSDTTEITARADFTAQKTAIEGTIQTWTASTAVEMMFLYAWDIRPLSSRETSLYKNWQTNYCINGKIELITLSAILQSIAQKARLAAVGTESMGELVFGYSIHNAQPVRNIITTLKKIYSFDVREEHGKLVFLHRKMNKVIDVLEEDIISEREVLTDTTYHASALIYISKQFDYQPRLKNPKAYKNLFGNLNILHITLVLDDLHAERVVSGLYEEAANAKCFFQLSLPIKYIVVDIGDIVRIRYNDSQHRFKVTDTKILDSSVHVEGYSCGECLLDQQS